MSTGWSVIDEITERTLNMDKVTVFKDGNDEWRWHRQAPNGKIISDSGEGYIDKSYCVEMAERANVDAKIEVQDD